LFFIKERLQVVLLGELRLPAVFENIRIVSQFIYGIAQRLDLNDETMFDIELAVEEATVNIIRYAYPSGRTGEMSLRVVIEDDNLQIALMDWGIPFDPSKIKPFDIDAPIEERIKGGMGLRLIQTVTDKVERQMAMIMGEPNTLTLFKHIQRVPAGVRRLSKTRELDAIRTVSQVMLTSLDLDNLLRLIIDKLVDTLDVERGTLYLVDEERGELISRILIEDSSALNEIRVKLGEGVAGYVAATGQMLNIEDAYADPRHIQTFDKLTGFRTRTILAAPLYNPQAKIIGVVQLLNKKGGPFTSRDERLLTVIAAQAAISIENARLYEQEIRQRLVAQELDTARRIQISFLPQSVPQLPGWEISAIWRPINSVAGDYFDFYTLPDGRLGLVIADVSGKGVPAALFMALSVTVLRFAMGLGLAPAELMDRANQLIIADQRSNMFATVFVGYLDTTSGIIQFASAGHNPPILYRAQSGTCQYLDAPGVALGIFKEADFKEVNETLAAGDVLVLYTDGITEAINDADEEFGETRLEDVIVQSAGLSAREIKDQVMEVVTEFSGGMVIDDETLVVIKRL
jgi:sigma-B regulation protein RsbU (phosphoserine phosphatase)